MARGNRSTNQFYPRKFMVAEFTWANRPAADQYEDQIIRITDVGIDGGLFVSDGTYWRPLNGSIVLANTNVPVGLAASWTGGAGSGVIATFGGNAPRVVSGYFHYPANSLATTTHDAGFYWTVLSTATAGVVYQSTYTASNTVTVPTSPTVVTAVDASATGGTAAVKVLSVPIKAGLLGVDGAIEFELVYETDGTTGDKECRFYLNDGTTNTELEASAITHTETTQYTSIIRGRVWNRGATDIQNAVTGFGLGTAVVDTAAIDTTVDSTFDIYLEKNAAEFSMISAARVSLVR
jgi:hypothetical protein